MSNSVAHESTIIQTQEGRATLIEQSGTFQVVDGEGEVQFTGNEVAAEFAYWRTTFGVPVEEGVQA